MGVRDLKGYGKRLRELRHKRGLTQAELADQTGLQQSQISQWEKGTLPSVMNHAALAAALDDDGYLIYGDDQ